MRRMYCMRCTSRPRDRAHGTFQHSLEMCAAMTHQIDSHQKLVAAIPQMYEKTAPNAVFVITPRFVILPMTLESPSAMLMVDKSQRGKDDLDERVWKPGDGCALMKKFYFVGGPKAGQAEEFFRRLAQIGGPPSGWRIYPHAIKDGKALHLVEVESQDEI